MKFARPPIGLLYFTYESYSRDAS